MLFRRHQPLLYVTPVLFALVYDSVALETHACSDVLSTWPESGSLEWHPVMGIDGRFLTDEAFDALAFYDAVGGTVSDNQAVAYTAFPAFSESIFFRVRLAEDPASTIADKWNSFSFHILLEVDNDTADESWDHAVVMNGPTGEIILGSNSIVDLSSGWCGDVSDENHCTYPAVVVNSSGLVRFPAFARVTPACSSFGTGGSCDVVRCQTDENGDGVWDGHPDSCSDQFLDLQLPAGDFQTISGVTDLETSRSVLGTSSNGNEINRDVLGGSCADAWSLLVSRKDHLFEDGFEGVGPH